MNVLILLHLSFSLYTKVMGLYNKHGSGNLRASHRICVWAGL